MPEITNVTITSREKTLDELPTYSGVYRFFSDASTLLYVGKSVDIRARVNSHFQEGRKAGRHQRIMSQVTRIETQPTAGEVGARDDLAQVEGRRPRLAVLLEAVQIKTRVICGDDDERVEVRAELGQRQRDQASEVRRPADHQEG